MQQRINFLAADLGASSGRVMLGAWHGERFSLEELHRFPNAGIEVAGRLQWDAPGIWHQIQIGMAKANVRFDVTPASIGVDAWGVDFGLIDSQGQLLGNPVHYRDPRTRGLPAKVFETVTEQSLFEATGTHTMEINTLFQLYSMVRAKDPQLLQADKLLMIPDLFLHLLTGKIAVEETAASTTQMYSLRKGDWARDMLVRLGMDTSLLPEIIKPGTIVGPVKDEVLRHCGFRKPFSAVAVASHDTASAVAATPGLDEESAFLSCGTWSMLGIEVPGPDTSEATRLAGFTNEAGVEGSVQLLKNISGLWTLQQCAQAWAAEGKTLTWDEIVTAASEAPRLRSVFDPNDARLQSHGDMPEAIRIYCRSTGQRVPGSIGELACCALESLTLKYRASIEGLEQLTGRQIRTIRIVGGGSQNRLLCQMTADACERTVVSGPAEASAFGNIMLQAIALGYLPGLNAAREALSRSVKCEVFEPRRTSAWDDAYEIFKLLEVG